MQTNNNNRSKRHVNKRRQQNQKRPPNNNNNNDKVMRLHTHIVPDKIYVPLRYFWPTVLLNNAGVRNASHQLRINAPFNVDATLGTQNSAGFAEWATLYQKYRVHRVELRASFVNNDAVPTFCAIQMSTVSYATNGLTMQFWQNDFTKWGPLGQSTGNDYAKVMTLDQTLERIVGDAAVKTDDDYAAAVTTVPTLFVYANVAIDTGVTAITMTNGALCRVELIMHTYFFNRAPFNA